MRTVWKFGPFEPGVTSIYIDMEAKIIHIGVQRHEIWLWAETDSTRCGVHREFYLAITGESLPWEYGTHVGTVVNNDIVFHLYEKTFPKVEILSTNEYGQVTQ